MTKNGYVNNVAKDLINELKSSDRNRSSLFINEIKGRYNTRGTYVLFEVNSTYGII